MRPKLRKNGDPGPSVGLNSNRLRGLATSAPGAWDDGSGVAGNSLKRQFDSGAARLKRALGRFLR